MCPHQKRGCAFSGTQALFEHHLQIDCKYEALKSFFEEVRLSSASKKPPADLAQFDRLTVRVQSLEARNQTLEKRCLSSTGLLTWI